MVIGNGMGFGIEERGGIEERAEMDGECPGVGNDGKGLEREGEGNEAEDGRGGRGVELGRGVEGLGPGVEREEEEAAGTGVEGTEGAVGRAEGMVGELGRSGDETLFSSAFVSTAGGVETSVDEARGGGGCVIVGEATEGTGGLVGTEETD